MRISELGEFGLIERIINRQASAQLRVPNGDDAAVLECGGALLAISVDSFVEGRHFRFDWSSPGQVGQKVIEASASDVVAMGARPRWALVSLSLQGGRPAAFVEALYSGMNSACGRIGAQIVGGDTVSGTAGLVVSITILGELVPGAQPCRRAGARPGDLLYVSGCLGGAAAGVEVLKRGLQGHARVKGLHQAPNCRIDLVPVVSKCASAMIDISDGLASELCHLASESKVACLVEARRIPQSIEAHEAAIECGCSALDLALYGGEDFELLFSAPPGSVPADSGTVEIGRVEQGSGAFIDYAGEIVELRPRGWDHFKGSERRDL